MPPQPHPWIASAASISSSASLTTATTTTTTTATITAATAATTVLLLLVRLPAPSQAVKRANIALLFAENLPVAGFNATPHTPNLKP